MLEVTLAVSVLVAVIMIGLLISIGNERQRRAIEAMSDRLNEWALGDLQIKREMVAREIQINDPIKWLDDMAQKATGVSPGVQGPVRVYDNPKAIQVPIKGNRAMVFSPVEPRRLRKLSKQSSSSSEQMKGEPAILGRRPGKAPAHELSALNAGVFFDLEVDKVWRELANQPLDANRLWVYEIEPPGAKVG